MGWVEVGWEAAGWVAAAREGAETGRAAVVTAAAATAVAATEAWAAVVGWAKEEGLGTVVATGAAARGEAGLGEGVGSGGAMGVGIRDGCRSHSGRGFRIRRSVGRSLQRRCPG